MPIPDYDELYLSLLDREEEVTEDPCDDYGCQKAEAEDEEEEY